jgi:hypothetical protein
MGRYDELGDAVRRVIGDLADDRNVYYKFAEVNDPSDMYLGKHMLSAMPGHIPVPAGSESGMLQPLELIKRSAYPDDLGRQAAKRLLGSPMQSPNLPNHIPLLMRPDRAVSSSGDVGWHVIKTDPAPSARSQAIEVAGGSSAPLRTLIHEARHATEIPGNDTQRALRSVAAAATPVDGVRLKDSARRYYARPSELLAYLGEAGDDFVRERGRLVDTVRDANAVMERIEAGESLQRLHPLVRQMYSGAYKQNPTARAHINDILTRYFAVPGAVAAGASLDGQPE